VAPAEVPERIERLLAQVKALGDELGTMRSQQAAAEAGDLAAAADDGVVVVRRDGLAPDDLKRLTLATRDALGSGVVAVVGAAPDGAKAAIAVAVSKDLVERGVSAAEIGRPVAKALGGGTGPNADFVQGGGPKVDGLDEAFALAQELAAGAVGS
jgi:alanyl-tRNA synthetase